MDWEGHVTLRADTGLTLHDITYRGERIAYELAQQVTAQPRRTDRCVWGGAWGSVWGAHSALHDITYRGERVAYELAQQVSAVTSGLKAAWRLGAG